MNFRDIPTFGLLIKNLIGVIVHDIFFCQTRYSSTLYGGYCEVLWLKSQISM